VILVLAVSMAALGQVPDSVWVAIIRGDYLSVTPECYIEFSQPYSESPPGLLIDTIFEEFYIDRRSPGDYG